MKKCAICGAEILKHGNHRKYCSEACSRKAEAKRQTKVISKRTNAINKVAHSVYRAYDCKCAICGWQATPEVITVKGKIQYAHGNEIHHIIPISEGGKEEDGNLILLCPNHHKQADMGIIDRETLRKYAKRFTLTEEEKTEMIFSVQDTIASQLF